LPERLNAASRFSLVSPRLLSLAKFAMAFVMPVAFSAESSPLLPIENDIARGYYARALGQLEPLLKSAPANSELHYLHASALLGLTQTDAAIAEASAAILADPGNAKLHRILGEAYGAAAEHAGPLSGYGYARDSLSEFRAAAQLAPNDAESHFDLARFYTLAPGIVGGSSEKAHHEAIILDTLSPVLAARARAYFATEDKDWGTAERELKQAVALDSKPESMDQLGMVYLRANRPKDALQTYKAMTGRFPDEAKAWYWLGRSAALANTDIADGIHALEYYLALAERPDDAPPAGWAQLRLAELQVLTADKESARIALNKARANPPGNDHDFAKELDLVASVLKAG